MKHKGKPVGVRAFLEKRVGQPSMVQVSPGRYVPAEGDVPPERCLAFWRGNADGSYEAVPYTDRLVRLNRELLVVLGLYDADHGRSSFNTMYRLHRAGFIEMVKAAPRMWMLNLDSWFNHLARVAEDAEFWAEGRGNIEAYREAL